MERHDQERTQKKHVEENQNKSGTCTESFASTGIPIQLEVLHVCQNVNLKGSIHLSSCLFECEYRRLYWHNFANPTA